MIDFKLSIDNLRSVYRAIPTAACLIGRDLKFLAANSRYADMMGVPLEQIELSSMLDINPQEHIANVRSDFRVFDAGGRVPDHHIFLGDCQYLVSVSPIRFGEQTNVSAISVTLTDITEIKRTKQKLADTIDQLKEFNQRLIVISATDSLTGLLNRRALNEKFDDEILRIRRNGGSIAVLMIDFDYFKAFNDRYGHLAGDECLRAGAQIIQEAMRRPADIAARFGGEEFLAVMPGTDLTGARSVAEGIAREVHQLAIPHDRSPFGRVTISAGLALQHGVRPTSTPASVREELIKRADDALYRAKAAGRNALSTAPGV